MLSGMFKRIVAVASLFGFFFILFLIAASSTNTKAAVILMLSFPNCLLPQAQMVIASLDSFLLAWRIPTCDLIFRASN